MRWTCSYVGGRNRDAIDAESPAAAADRFAARWSLADILIVVTSDAGETSRFRVVLERTEPVEGDLLCGRPRHPLKRRLIRCSVAALGEPATLSYHARRRREWLWQLGIRVAGVAVRGWHWGTLDGERILVDLEVGRWRAAAGAGPLRSWQELLEVISGEPFGGAQPGAFACRCMAAGFVWDDWPQPLDDVRTVRSLRHDGRRWCACEATGQIQSPDGRTVRRLEEFTPAAAELPAQSTERPQPERRPFVSMRDAPPRMSGRNTQRSLF